MDEHEIDPTLARQLKRVGLQKMDRPPDLDSWKTLLKRVSEHYRHVREDRDLLNRSLELSSREMQTINDDLRREQKRLKEVLAAFGDALSTFRDAAGAAMRADQVDGVTTAVNRASDSLAKKLAQILDPTDQRVDANESSELASIARDFSALSERFVGMLYEVAQSESLRRELEIARAVQQMLLPEQNVIERPFIKIAAGYQPAAECGGDWWTAHDLEDGRVLIVVGDVTGHGVASAIITGAAKSASDIARMVYRKQLSCEKLLTMMNRAIFDAANQQRLMTCAAAIIDPHTRTLTTANAGHPFPFLVRRHGDGFRAQGVVAHGAPLGATRDAVYAPVTVDLENEDVLVWYTDGVLECENDRGELFGEKQLRQIIEHGGGWQAKAIRDSIVHALRRFSTAGAARDDMTFVIAKVEFR